MYQEAGYPSPVNLSPDTLYDLISDFSNKLEQHYWMPDLNAYALALDGQGKQVKIVNSDVGLGLYYRLFRNDRVDELYTTLIDPERLLSPIGVRTISKEHKIYNSSSYLQGAVWPWQLAIILAGIPKYGLDQLPFLDRFYNLSLSGSLHEVYDADAVLHSSVSLKDGHSTCVEQRWSAAVPWLALIEGILGIDISYQTEQTEIMEMLSQLKDTSGYSISNLYIKGKRF